MLEQRQNLRAGFLDRRLSSWLPFLDSLYFFLLYFFFICHKCFLDFENTRLSQLYSGKEFGTASNAGRLLPRIEAKQAGNMKGPTASAAALTQEMTRLICWVGRRVCMVSPGHYQRVLSEAVCLNSWGSMSAADNKVAGLPLRHRVPFLFLATAAGWQVQVTRD